MPVSEDGPISRGECTLESSSILATVLPLIAPAPGTFSRGTSRDYFNSVDMAELMATGGFIGASQGGGNEHGNGAAMRLTQQHSWPGAVSRCLPTFTMTTAWLSGQC